MKLPVIYDLAETKERYADSSIRGYLTQFIYTAILWVELDDDTKLITEGLEDADKIIEHDGSYRTISQDQLKDLSRAINIRDEDVKKSIANFLHYFKENPDSSCKFKFVTTTTLKKNNKANGLTCDVLKLWGIETSSEEQALEIFKNLNVLFSSVPSKEKASDKVKRERALMSIQWIKAQELGLTFVDSVSWVFDLGTADEQQLQLTRTIGKRFPEVISEQFADRVLNAVVFSSAKADVYDRILDLKQLQKLVDDTSEEYEDFAKRVGLERLSNYQLGVLDRDTKLQFQQLADRSKFASFDYKGEVLSFSDGLVDGDFSKTNDKDKAEFFEKMGMIAVGRDELEHALIFRQLSGESDSSRDLTLLDFVLRSKKDREVIELLLESDDPRAKSLALVFVDKLNLWPDYRQLDWTDPSKKGNLLLVLRKQNEREKLSDVLDTIHDEDLKEVSTVYLAAMAHLHLSVPEIDAKNLIIAPANIYEIEFLAGQKNHTEAARKLFAKSIPMFDALNLRDERLRAEDFDIWISLSAQNSELYEAGKNRVIEGLESKELSIRLRWVWWAIQLGVEIVQSRVESDIWKFTKEHGSTNESSSAAYALVRKAESAKDALRALDQLGHFLPIETRVELRIQCLLMEGEAGESAQHLDEQKSKLNDYLLEKLELLIWESENEDECEKRILLYQKHEDVHALRNLVAILDEKELWKKSTIYRQVLFEESSRGSDFEGLLKAHYQLKEDLEVLCLLNANSEFLCYSRKTKMIWLRSNYFLGNFNECYKQCEIDKEFCDGMHVTLAISSGCWEKLPSEIKRSLDEDNDPETLLRMANIALFDAPTRVKTLLKKAVEHACHDPQVYATAWFTSIQIDETEDSEAGEWLHEAIKLSGEDGPLQQVSISELIPRGKDWVDGSEEIRSLLRSGDILIAQAAQQLNLPLFQHFYLIAQLNAKEEDAKIKEPIFAFSGVQRGEFNSIQIQLEATSILTLSHLSILDLVIENYEVEVPHSTMSWLFEERGKIGNRQRSTLNQAKLLTTALGQGRISVLQSQEIVVPLKLIKEVGRDLAELLVRAKESGGLVVRGNPIYAVDAIDTILNDKWTAADLTEFYGNIISVQQLVVFLIKEDKIPLRRIEGINDRLKTSKRGDWENVRQITSDTQLYLDHISLVEIHQVGFFDILTTLKQSLCVSQNAINHARRVERFEEHREALLVDVRTIQQSFKEAISNGRVRVQQKCSHENLANHPTLDSLLEEGGHLLITDDRMVNKCLLRKNKKGIFTSLNLLKHLEQHELISNQRYYSCLHSLRESMFILIPVDLDELPVLLDQTELKNGKMVETSRLKVFREYYFRLRMEHCVRWDEHAWLAEFCVNISDAIKAQWENAALDLETIVARSDWLLELADLRYWASFSGEDLEDKLCYFFHVSFLRIFTIHKLVGERRGDYETWVQSRLLEPASPHPFVKKELVSGYKEIVKNWSEENGSEDVLGMIFHLPLFAQKALTSDRAFMESIGSTSDGGNHNRRRTAVFSKSIF